MNSLGQTKGHGWQCDGFVKYPAVSCCSNSTVVLILYMDVLLKMVSTPKANGFHDHYPYEKWL